MVVQKKDMKKNEDKKRNYDVFQYIALSLKYYMEVNLY